MNEEKYSGGLPLSPAVQIKNVPVTYMGKPVMTTATMAAQFVASEKQIADNFANNVIRFEEGVHFHKVVGDALRALKNEPDFIGLVGKTASHLLLWTKRGVSRHAKILDTETAWEIYEKLEDTYFAIEEGRSASRPMTPAEMFLHNAQAMVDIERKQLDHDRAISDLGATVARVEQAQTILSSRPANAESIVYICKRVGKLFGLSETTVKAVMRSLSYRPREAGMVRNDKEEALGNTFAVYWRQDVNKCFRQFAGECYQVTATMWTHPQIDGRFKMALPKSEVN